MVVIGSGGCGEGGDDECERGVVSSIWESKLVVIRIQLDGGG